MNSSYNKPVFTSMSDLTAAALNNEFVLNWVYPTDYTDLTTHDPTQVVEYKLYRHIEQKYPSYSANGGLLINPITYNPDINYLTNDPKFKLVTTLPKTVTAYTDTLDDLELHADERITYNGTTWVDGAGADVVYEIFNTQRRIYYKIVAVTKKMSFNKTPFMFICHTDGVECRSTITQVKWNTLYYEGDTVWFNNAITNCSRTAVDLTIDANTDRTYNVWVSGLGTSVYCLNGRTGELKHTFILPVNNILGIRVDPDTGDCIATGNGSVVYRCNLNSGAVSSVINTGTAYAPNGNTGLTLVKEGNNHFAYVITNQDVIAKCGIDTAINSVVPRTEFGCSNNTNANIPNILGITNSTDGAVWVNGHVPINYRYYYTYTSYSTTEAWASFCPNGSPTAAILAYYYGRGNTATPYCSWTKHHTTQTTSSTTTVDIDLNFLQDIGYIYGAADGINRGATNGAAYPYGNNTGYKPFTSKSSRSGWFGVSPQGADTYGRPYTSGSSVDPKNTPNPSISQKGLASDIPSDGDLTGKIYNIFQTNEAEDRIHKLTWNGVLSTLNYNYLSSTESVGVLNQDYWSINNPVHVGVDSQNNIWVIREGISNDQLTLIYQNVSTRDFPFGGDCRWPTLLNLNGTFGRTSAYTYGDYFSDPYVEYYLTRDIDFTGLTATPTIGYRNGFGIILSGNPIDQKEIARTWCLSGTNYITQGKKLYTNYTGASSTVSFARYGGDTVEYNSDNFGTVLAMGEHSVEVFDIAHPAPAYPQVRLNITGLNSSPQNCDSDFWNDQIITNSSHEATSGYDDFQVQLSATLLSMGSFAFEGYKFYFDDKIKDVGGNTNPISITTTSNTINYDYNDPSINGKPNVRWTGTPAEDSGVYNPYVEIVTQEDAYILSGENTLVGTSNTTDAIVWERWPTAKFYTNPHDNVLLRQAVLSSWNLSSYSYDSGNNGHPLNSDTRIISGYDPLSAQFTDTSISRTWPISAWFWTFGDKPHYLGFPLTNSIFGAYVSYPHVTSQIITASDPISLRDDCITEHKNMVEHVYKGAGNYYATLWVMASNTGTDSWQISAGITDQNFMASSFVIAASRRIDVLEICPNIEFEFTTAVTAPSTYSNDTGPSFISVSANRRYDSIFSTYGLISGYAPYLEISFTGSATARSLPLRGLKWDFNDPFVDLSDEDVTLYNYPTAGWPLWNNEPYYTSGSHIFIMPGFYDVVLQPLVSGNTVDYISNCSGLRKHMHVYVEELPITACFLNSYDQTSAYTSNTLSGISPTTIYVNPWCTNAGSFPICRIDWDFGDNTPIASISRMMSSEYINYYNTSSYSDLSDPRNIVLSHEYSRTQFNQPSSYTLSMSAYACNTNTMSIVSREVGPIEMAKVDDIEGELHIIENRMYGVNDDLLLVFEGQKSLNNFTVLLSTDQL